MDGSQVLLTVGALPNGYRLEVVYMTVAPPHAALLFYLVVISLTLDWFLIYQLLAHPMVVSVTMFTYP
jgi:hypothetical protein